MVRRLTTKELLAESLLELVKEEPLEKITIGAIASNCGLSTRTFYNNFLDKYDLINWIYIHRVEAAYGRLGSDLTWRQLLEELITLMSEQDTFFRQALADRTEDVNLTDSAIHRGLDLLLEYIGQEDPQLRDDESLHFQASMYFYGIMAMLRRWLRDGRAMSVEDIVTYCFDAMPEALKPYLED